MSLIPWKNKRESRAEYLNELAPVARFRRELDDLFGQFFRESAFPDLAASHLGWGPRMDMTESDNEVTLRFDLPGVNPKELDISVSGNLLTLRGERNEEKETRSESCVYTERAYGSFARTAQLPASVDPNDIDASYKDGVLTVRLTKRPDAKARKITVRMA